MKKTAVNGTVPQIRVCYLADGAQSSLVLNQSRWARQRVVRECCPLGCSSFYGLIQRSMTYLDGLSYCKVFCESAADSADLSQHYCIGLCCRRPLPSPSAPPSQVHFPMLDNLTVMYGVMADVHSVFLPKYVIINFFIYIKFLTTFSTLSRLSPTKQI